MFKFHNLAIKGLIIPCLFSLPPAFAQDASEIVRDDLITSSNLSTAWQSCGSDSPAIDPTLLDAGGCAFRTTPVEDNTLYRMTCAVSAVKFASITLAFLDANDNTVASESTDIFEDQVGAFSVTLQAPAGATTAAIGIYGEAGSGFQDCVLVDATPTPEPTKGSIAGLTFFDDNADGNSDPDDAGVSRTNVSLYLSGVRIDQIRTDDFGNYFFGNLDIDRCYQIGFTSADATLQLGTAVGDAVALTDGTTGDVCLTENAPDAVEINAAFIPVPPVVPPADNVICGVAWLDDNSNGVFDGTDSTLRNVKATLLGDNNQQIDMTRTGENGAYVFENLAVGSYQVVFTTPDGHEPTTGVNQPSMGSSYVNAQGQTQVFSLPGDGNTAVDSACTIQHVNAGYVQLPVVIPPTIANDDSIELDSGDAVLIDFLANDEICDGTVAQVDVLGHNVPGSVSYNEQQQRLTLSGATQAGTYSIEYGVRGTCGSYDTATVVVEINEPPAPVSPAAPDAPICRAEVGGADNGGVDVFNAEEFGFASEYIVFNQNREPLQTLINDSTYYQHKWFIGDTDSNRRSRIKAAYIGFWEIEWNGVGNNFDQTAVYYVAAVENGVQSELSLCARDNYSPIALDLDGIGTIKRINGEFSIDLNNDGINELLTEWFAPNAGILITSDASGQANGKHLFGNVPGIHEDGYSELATLDADNNGTLTGSELESLAIWKDTNSDTVIDTGEIESLEQHDIVSLSVNHYKFMARATKANGKTLLMEDVWLQAAFISALK